VKNIILLWTLGLLCLQANAQKQCATSNSPNFSVLLDLSEPLDPPSLIAFNTFAKRMLEVMPSGGKFNVYTIKLNAEDVEKKPDFEICIPDFDSMKGITYKNRAKQKFQEQVLPKLEELGQVVTPAKKSPILENIFKISHATFLKNGLTQNQTLVVVSDLVQFSDLTDFYKDIPSYKSFSGSNRVSSWLPKVNTVKLNLILLNTSSSNKVDLKKIRNFWMDYSKNNFKECVFSGINEVAVSFKNDC
jgi:hypothetical protein